MKKTLIMVGIACALFACGNADEEKANAFLTQAEQSWKSGNYNVAKQWIDSIRMVYPKAIEARRNGVRLMQKVELDEQKRSLAFLDSMMQQKQAKFQEMRSQYVLEKDTAYQEIGNYFAPSQITEKNINRTFLRAQVSEEGKLTLTSIYCGSAWIHHKAVKAYSGEVTIETPASTDVYETTDLGWKIEKADYPMGQDGGLAAFIAQNPSQTIRLEFVGDRTHKLTMSAADKQAIAKVFQLAQVLSAIQEIKRQQAEANRKIQFINHRIEEQTASEQTQE